MVPASGNDAFSGPGNPLMQWLKSPRRWPGPIAIAWCAAALLLAIGSVWGHMQIGMNNDHAVLMDSARKLLAGAIPYVDYTDVSPPLIHLIYTIPIAMAKLLGITTDTALNAYTIAAIAFWRSAQCLSWISKTRA
jgi:hypothetical protein